MEQSPIHLSLLTLFIKKEKQRLPLTPDTDRSRDTSSDPETDTHPGPEADGEMGSLWAEQRQPREGAERKGQSHNGGTEEQSGDGAESGVWATRHPD